MVEMGEGKTLKLPEPRLRGHVSVEEALASRRTVRRVSERDVELSAVSQLLWALQGTTRVEEVEGRGRVHHRAAPSAGMTYPLGAYVVYGGGLYRFDPIEHALRSVVEEDVRGSLSEAMVSPLNREAVMDAPLTVILTADNDRAMEATPLMENAVRYVHLEAGHAAQNLALQAASMGLGVCTITSYEAAKVYKALELPRTLRPIYIMPVGYPDEGDRLTVG